MTLLQLKYVVVIDEEKSMRKASDRLYVSQPRLSVAVKELENEIGITIFRRIHKGVVTTEEGKVFIAHARNVLDEYKNLEQRYSNGSGSKVIFSVSMQHYMFAVNAYIRLLEEYDNDEYCFTMKETKTDEVIEDVKNYKSEVGVIALNDFNSGMLKGILSDCNLEFHELFRSSTHVYLHKAHPLAGREELSLEELKEYPCVVYDQGDKTSFYYREEMLARYDYKKTIVSNDRASSADLLEGCNGYMIGTGILGGVISDDIAVIKLREQEELTLGYIVRKGYRSSDMGKRYIQLLQEYSDKV